MNEDRLQYLELTVGSQPFSVVPELTEEIRALQAEVERLQAEVARLHTDKIHLLELLRWDRQANR